MNRRVCTFSRCFQSTFKAQHWWKREDARPTPLIWNYGQCWPDVPKGHQKTSRCLVFNEGFEGWNETSTSVQVMTLHFSACFFAFNNVFLLWTIRGLVVTFCTDCNNENSGQLMVDCTHLTNYYCNCANDSVVQWGQNSYRCGNSISQLLKVHRAVFLMFLESWFFWSGPRQWQFDWPLALSGHFIRTTLPF